MLGGGEHEMSLAWPPGSESSDCTTTDEPTASPTKKYARFSITHQHSKPTLERSAIRVPDFRKLAL